MSVALPAVRVEVLRGVELNDDDFQEGWTASEGFYSTDGEIGTLSISIGATSAFMSKSCSFNSSTHKYATVSCTSLNADTWQFEVRRASDQVWVAVASFTETGVKTVDISGIYSGDVDMVGIRVLGNENEGGSFDYVVISSQTLLVPSDDLDVLDARIHLGMVDEVGSFELTLQNFEAKYTGQIGVGDKIKIWLGREGSELLKTFTGRIEEIEFSSTSTENYLLLRGRDRGEELFRRTVTKTYENQKAEDVVKDLIDNFTDLKHLRGSTELVENSDTTFTRLEYENTPVFDILKDVAKSTVKNGVVGFDFRVAWDGKFEFFQRNTKTSQVSLSERIEVAHYSKDIGRIRNKIVVYGAAEKSLPSDRDGMTEAVTNAYGVWSSGTGTGSVSTDATVKIMGSYSLKHTTSTSDYYGCAVFTLNNAVDTDKYPSLTFQIRRESAFSGGVTIELEDSAGMKVTRNFYVDAEKWALQSFVCGAKNTDQWTHDLTNSQNLNWAEIKKIRFYCFFSGTGTGSFWIDNLFFNSRRWTHTTEDTTSQSTYGLRELVEVDEELHSDSDCEKHANALLKWLKDPAEHLTLQSNVIDPGSNRLLPGDMIHVTLPNEGIDGDYRILTVEHRVSSRDQMWEVTLELGKEPVRLASIVSELQSRTSSLARYKAGGRSVAGVGGSSGGGLTPSDTVVSEENVDSTPSAGTATTYARGDHTHGAFRRWKWADEPSWRKYFELPYGKPVKYSGNPILIPSASGWDSVFVGMPCITRKGSKYYLFYVGSPSSGWGSEAIGVAYATAPEGPFTKYSGNPIIPHQTGYSYTHGPNVVYDRIDGKWKMWFMVKDSAASDAVKYTETSDDEPFANWTTPVDVAVPSDYKVNGPVFRVGNSYLLFYTPTGDGVSVALGDSETIFTKVADILSLGASGEWDDSRLRRTSGTWLLGVYYILYSGYDGFVWKGGFAFGANPFSTLQKFPGNPILDPGNTGDWDEAAVMYPSMIMAEDKFYIYYWGWNSNQSKRKQNRNRSDTEMVNKLGVKNR